MRSTTERGYGYEHQQERRRVATTVEAGEATCCRCGRWIAPGTAWDLDHTDDRQGYRGPAHRRCNRRAGGRRGGLAAAGKLPRKGRQRRWV